MWMLNWSESGHRWKQHHNHLSGGGLEPDKLDIAEGNTTISREHLKSYSETDYCWKQHHKHRATHNTESQT